MYDILKDGDSSFPRSSLEGFRDVELEKQEALRKMVPDG